MTDNTSDEAEMALLVSLRGYQCATIATQMSAISREPTRLVIGTAGHVDHGKTSLVRVLTGVDTDRLPEEKARGISIELGFAPLTLSDGRRAAIVDVPGHERFLHTMVAGATGVDLLVLVIAGDESVMPQTREHLDICALLGMRRGIIALTKMDLVDPELRELAIDEVREALRGTFLEKAPIIPCSNVTRQGLEELKHALVTAMKGLPARSVDGPSRLPIDRLFTIKGSGTIVTGTVASGEFKEGDSVVVLPGEARARLRSIEVHGEKRDVAWAGERAAFNLAGVDRDVLRRGATVTRQGTTVASTCIDVELTWLPVCRGPLGRKVRLLFHALTTQEVASVYPLAANQIEPGATGFARVYLDRPVALLPGDRFVLRGFRVLPGYGTSVGGGRVVRLLTSPRCRRDSAAFETVRHMAVAQVEQRVLLELREAGVAGLSRMEVIARTGLGGAVVDAAADALLKARHIEVLGREPGRLVAVSEIERIQKVVLEMLEQLCRRTSTKAETGISREELRTSSPRLSRLDPSIFAAIVDRLSASHALESAGDLVSPRNWSVSTVQPTRSAIGERVAAIVTNSGLAPPSPEEISVALGVDLRETADALKMLLGRGEVVRIGRTFFFSRLAIDDLRERLRAFLIARGAISTQEMKALAGGSRKYVIPLAEYFDAERLTLRTGDVRRLRTPAQPARA